MTTNTITARETRDIIASLDRIKELTDLLRHAHFEVPYAVVYDAVGAEASLRNRLFGVALRDIAIETPILEAAE